MIGFGGSSAHEMACWTSVAGFRRPSEKAWRVDFRTLANRLTSSHLKSEGAFQSIGRCGEAKGKTLISTHLHPFAPIAGPPRAMQSRRTGSLLNAYLPPRRLGAGGSRPHQKPSTAGEGKGKSFRPADTLKFRLRAHLPIGASLAGGGPRPSGTTGSPRKPMRGPLEDDRHTTPDVLSRK